MVKFNNWITWEDIKVEKLKDTKSLEGTGKLCWVQVAPSASKKAKAFLIYPVSGEGYYVGKLK